MTLFLFIVFLIFSISLGASLNEGLLDGEDVVNFAIYTVCLIICVTIFMDVLIKWNHLHLVTDGMYQKYIAVKGK